GESHRLADGVQRALERLRGRYGGGSEPRSGAMAVLDPRTVGRATSACLVEVDYLSNPRSEQRLRDPSQRAAIGAAIASAIQEHVATRKKPRGSTYAEAKDVLTDMRDTRASDTLRVSTVAEGQAVVDQYLARGSRTVWPNIDIP